MDLQNHGLSEKRNKPGKIFPTIFFHEKKSDLKGDFGLNDMNNVAKIFDNIRTVNTIKEYKKYLKVVDTVSRVKTV